MIYLSFAAHAVSAKCIAWIVKDKQLSSGISYRSFAFGCGINV